MAKNCMAFKMDATASTNDLQSVFLLYIFSARQMADGSRLFADFLCFSRIMGELLYVYIELFD